MFQDTFLSAFDNLKDIVVDYETAVSWSKSVCFLFTGESMYMYIRYMYKYCGSKKMQNFSGTNIA